MSDVKLDIEDLVEDIINNLKSNYLSGNFGEVTYEIQTWIELVGNMVHNMIVGNIDANELIDEYLKELLLAGIEIGKVYNLCDPNINWKEVLTPVYVICIYSRAVNYNNPEYMFSLTETTFQLKKM